MALLHVVAAALVARNRLRAFVPVVNPFWEMYLRTHNICAQFEKRASCEVDNKGYNKGDTSHLCSWLP